MNEKKIIFMSRLDSDCSIGAHLLCDVAQALYEKYPSLKIYVIGGGTEYEKIRDRAEKINSELNHSLITVLGSISDPQRFFEGDSIFIGVSRSAMEAMAHGLPVILLGNEGYLGLLDEEKMQSAIRTNLTCRSLQKPPSPSQLYAEIIRCCELSDTEKAQLSALYKNTVRKHFSARRMARETLQFYRQTVKEYHHHNTHKRSKKKKKITLCGYYGRRNFGDEMILSQIANKIKQSSAWQKDVDLRIIKDKNPARVISSLYGCDLFIFGGGSLLQNATSDASLMFYICVIILSRVLSKRTIMLSNGLGPFKSRGLQTSFLRKALVSALNSFDLISVRDTDSQRMLKKILPGRRIHLIYDPALIYFKDKLNSGIKKESEIVEAPILSSERIKDPQIVFIPNERALKEGGVSNAEAISNVRVVCRELNAKLVIVALSKSDRSFAKAELEGDEKVISLYSASPETLTSILYRSSLCITQRYHGALFSCACSIPTLAVSDDPKIKTFCRELQLSAATSVSVFKSPVALLSQCKAAIAQHSQIDSARRETMRKRADKVDVQLDKIVKIFI